MSDLWYALPNLDGGLIRLEPLELHHAAGYLSAAGTGSDAAEVFRWLNPPGGGLAEPVTIEDAERHILAALAARARGERFPYAQIDVRTGDFAGTSSYYEVNPAARAWVTAVMVSLTAPGRPILARSPSSIDSAPKLMRVTPARYSCPRPCSEIVEGWASTVISQSEARVKCL